MKRLCIAIGLCLALVACGGIPLSALPRLVQLNSSLLEADPADFSVALQVDARLVPPPAAVPHLILKLTPSRPGGFVALDKRLPMQVAVSASAGLGLDAPAAGRRWLIYTLPGPTQAELRELQARIRALQAAKGSNGGGSLGVGVEQDALVSPEPALANTRWSTWLRTRQAEGFYEVWNGTPAQILKLAAEARR